MNKMMKILALVLALAMMTCFLAACGKDNQTDDNKANDKGSVTEPNTTEPQGTEPDGSEPSTTPDDGKKEYKITVTDSNGNPMSGVLVQICKEGSTCFTPTRTNDQGVATWRLDEGADYYGTVSSSEPGMPKEYFVDKTEVTLVYEIETKKEYKIVVKDSDGNPVSGVLVQVCKEGSTCFTPTRTNDDGFAVWKLDAASDYYGTVSSLEEGMPKEFFGDAFEVVLVYNPPVAE